MSKASTIDSSDVEPLLSMHDAERRLRVHRHTVRKLMGEGRLRFIRIGREFRFKREWIEALIEEKSRAKRGR
jgi:excisionase family DNA binding protein